MNLDQLERDATEALASYPNGSSIVMDTRDVLKLTALRASHQRLKEALEELRSSCDDSDDARYGTLGTSFVASICDAALKDAP